MASTKVESLNTLPPPSEDFLKRDDGSVSDDSSVEMNKSSTKPRPATPPKRYRREIAKSEASTGTAFTASSSAPSESVDLGNDIVPTVIDGPSKLVEKVPKELPTPSRPASAPTALPPPPIPPPPPSVGLPIIPPNLPVTKIEVVPPPPPTFSDNYPQGGSQIPTLDRSPPPNVGPPIIPPNLLVTKIEVVPPPPPPPKLPDNYPQSGSQTQTSDLRSHTPPPVSAPPKTEIVNGEQVYIQPHSQSPEVSQPDSPGISLHTLPPPPPVLLNGVDGALPSHIVHPPPPPIPDEFLQPKSRPESSNGESGIHPLSVSPRDELNVPPVQPYEVTATAPVAGLSKIEHPNFSNGQAQEPQVKLWSPIPNKGTVTTLLNNQPPPSVLKIRGGKSFTKPRASPPPVIRLTTEDILPLPKPASSDQASSSRPVKKVTFSEPELPAAVTTSDEIRLSKKQRKNLTQSILARRQVNIFRNEAEIERRNFASRRDQLYKTLQKILPIGDEMIAQFAESDPERSEEFRKTWDFFTSLADMMIVQNPRLQDVEEKLLFIESNLVSLDIRLREKEERTLDLSIARHGDDNEENQDDDGDDDTGESVSQRTASTSTNQPSIVRDYYDKIGEVRLTKDYIHNLDTEHKQKVNHRKGKREMGAEPSIPDDKFYQEYFVERHELIHYYATTKHAVQVLYRLCQESGHDVEQPDLPPQDPDMDLSYRPGAGGWILYNMGPPSGDEIKSFASVIPPNSAEPVIPSKTKVADWMKAVEMSLHSLKPESEYSFDLAGSTKSDIIEPVVESYESGDEDHASSVRSTHHPITIQSAHFQRANFGWELPKRHYSDPNLRLTALDEAVRDKRRLIRTRRAFSFTE